MSKGEGGTVEEDAAAADWTGLDDELVAPPRDRPGLPDEKVSLNAMARLSMSFSLESLLTNVSIPAFFPRLMSSSPA